MFRAIVLLLTLLSIIFLAVSAPIGTPVNLDKRITHTGKGTWFYPGLGNCGLENSSSDPIVAIPKSLYDQNGGSNCGQWIHITNMNTGQTAYARAEDSCPGCGSDDLDMSPAVFEQLASLDTGVVPISWNFLAAGQSPP
ncbi:hypothetical protein GYMLUDRAFT_170897 [Collybiopsis luxurians FD-317 M1]|uniref:Unplaced genomic scaffold GYMLUscaffold_36, whole genome shotgun sequence n=1 Tax=Collybiopsis luxurians FD-317 M1 TaxID=944289 RepID=A0A0D0CJN8_9AGAR|nr:hypothetical protein GYMLUDRAFT_170897 [Collybiopsis luxurians FD-317 M1]